MRTFASYIFVIIAILHIEILVFSSAFLLSQRRQIIKRFHFSRANNNNNNNKHNDNNGGHFFDCHKDHNIIICLFLQGQSSSDENDDQDSKENSHSYNKKQNQQWLIDELKFPKSRTNSESPHNFYKFLAQDNSVLLARADWLQQALDLTDDERNIIFKKHSTLLSYKLDTKMEPTLDCLRTSLKLDKKSLKKMVLKQPRVLTSRVHDIEPKLNYFKSLLDLDEAKLGKIVSKNPVIFTFSTGTLKQKIDWLQQRLNLDDNEASRFIRKFSAFFRYSISDNMEPNLQWLEKRLSLADNKQLSSIIMSQPQLLYLDTDSNLGPTLEFYVDALGSEDDAIAFVCKNPFSFTRSLEKCLHPRLAEAREAGLDIDCACIRRMVFSTKERWGRDLEKRRSK